MPVKKPLLVWHLKNNIPPKHQLFTMWTFCVTFRLKHNGFARRTTGSCWVNLCSNDNSRRTTRGFWAEYGHANRSRGLLSRSPRIGRASRRSPESRWPPSRANATFTARKRRAGGQNANFPLYSPDGNKTPRSCETPISGVETCRMIKTKNTEMHMIFSETLQFFTFDLIAIVSNKTFIIKYIYISKCTFTTRNDSIRGSKYDRIYILWRPKFGL